MRWSFGVEPLAQSRTLAALVRRVVGLAVSLEAPHAAVDRLIDELGRAEKDLAAAAPADPAPRLGREASSTQRPYIDHSRDIGDFNPCFPDYEIRVDGDRATGTVRFPLAYEGPPGIVHGGFLAVFFDSAMQHHNCDVGQAGKTTSLSLRYRRPTPLLRELRFEIERTAADERIASTARLLADDVLLCEAEMRAFAGDLSAMPKVSPRRTGA